MNPNGFFLCIYVLGLIPVKLEHRLQSNPAIAQLDLLLKKVVSREIVVSEIILNRRRERVRKKGNT